MPDEKGFVLILTIVVICMLTISAALLANRTLFATTLALRRPQTVQAFGLAESGALEGFWQLTRNPEFRTTGAGVTKVFKDANTGFSGSYRYRIIDPTPDDLQDDLELVIVSEGWVGRWKRRIQLSLTRPGRGSVFQRSDWQEEKE